MSTPNWTDSGLKEFPYPAAGRNWTTTPGDDEIETQMDNGSKARRRFSSTFDKVSFTKNYTTADLALLDAFRNTTCKSVLPFSMTDPETGAAANWRFIGKPPRKALGGGVWQVTINLMRLP